MFSLAAGIAIALIFFLPFVNLEAAVFYINFKGEAMLFGRHPEGVDMDFTDIDTMDNRVSEPQKGVDNVAMDENKDNIYYSLRSKSETYETPTYTRVYPDLDLLASPEQVTEL